MGYTLRVRTWLESLELQLDDLLRKRSPVQLPDSARKSLATNLWWIALILGSLQFCAAWLFWREAERVERLVDFANSVSIYGVTAPTSGLGFFFYLSILLLAVDGLLLILAFQSLQKYLKQGWNLLFYSMLLNLVGGAAMVFSDYGLGLADFIRALFFSGVGAYFLFQVREFFVDIRPSGAVVGVEKTSEKTVK